MNWQNYRTINPFYSQPHSFPPFQGPFSQMTSNSHPFLFPNAFPYFCQKLLFPKSKEEHKGCLITLEKASNQQQTSKYSIQIFIYLKELLIAKMHIVLTLKCINLYHFQLNHHQRSEISQILMQRYPSDSNFLAESAKIIQRYGQHSNFIVNQLLYNIKEWFYQQIIAKKLIEINQYELGIIVQYTIFVIQSQIQEENIEEYFMIIAAILIDKREGNPQIDFTEEIGERVSQSLYIYLQVRQSFPSSSSNVNPKMAYFLSSLINLISLLNSSFPSFSFYHWAINRFFKEASRITRERQDEMALKFAKGVHLVTNLLVLTEEGWNYESQVYWMRQIRDIGELMGIQPSIIRQHMKQANSNYVNGARIVKQTLNR